MVAMCPRLSGIAGALIEGLNIGPALHISEAYPPEYIEFTINFTLHSPHHQHVYIWVGVAMYNGWRCTAGG
jgi:hypothetical protein